MSKGFYVVWVGRQPGIYTTWSECEKQTKGFRNAKHKKFKSFEEAEQAFENPPLGTPLTKSPSQYHTGARTCEGGLSGTIKLTIQEGGDKKFILEGHVDDVCKAMNNLNM